MIACGNERFFPPTSEDLSYNAPLFERLPTGNHPDDGYSEVRECKAFMEMQQRRIQDLERITTDLEKRLEQQARERMKIEKEVAENKRSWEWKYVQLEKERDSWKAKHEKELLHVQKLREQVRRLERELHGFLQKKYDFMQASKGGKGVTTPTSTGREGQSGGGPSVQRSSTPGAGGSSLPNGRAALETVSLNPKNFNPEAVREKQVIQSLCEFFGF